MKYVAILVYLLLCASSSYIGYSIGEKIGIERSYGETKTQEVFLCEPKYYVYPPGSMVAISRPIFVPSGHAVDSLFIQINDDFIGKSIFRYPYGAECTRINGNKIVGANGLVMWSMDKEPSEPAIYTSNIYDSVYKTP